jgi:NADPH2:quinone reductase
VLKLEERPAPTPGPGQALVQLAETGVNFVEIYQRMGWYKIPLPSGLGGEGAGVVQEVAPDVTVVRPGDRVAFLSGSGAYATHSLVPADRLVPVPEELSLEEAAASMVQGLTAHVLATRTYPVKPGDRVLVHAAAGGVGRLLCQVSKMQGGFVIGTVSSEAKAKIAREAGADEAVIYTQEDFEAAVKRITGGKGVNVAYDSVGKDTFDKSLASLAC